MAFLFSYIYSNVALDLTLTLEQIRSAGCYGFDVELAVSLILETSFDFDSGLR